MAITSDTILFSLSHFYHTSITPYHKTSVSFLREIKGFVCITNGLIFSKLTTFVRKHPGVARTDTRMFKEPTSGCTGVKMGMQRIFSALFWQKRSWHLDVKVCISDV